MLQQTIFEIYAGISHISKFTLFIQSVNPDSNSEAVISLVSHKNACRYL